MEIALYQPEIPPNTGNIARLCVCTGSPLHIIGRPNFDMDEKAVKRAGLDYWDRLVLHRHKDWRTFADSVGVRAKKRADLEAAGRAPNILLVSKFGKCIYWNHPFRGDEILVFGMETDGLPEFIHEEIRSENPDHILRIPMTPESRSLNLANAASIVLYEGLRQAGFAGTQNTSDKV